MIFQLVLLFFLDDIRLPYSLVNVDELLQVEEHFYLLDTHGPGIYLLNKNGEIINTLSKKGSGPGELQKPFGMAVFDGKVYVVDLMRRNLMVYTANLDFIREYPLGLLCRSVAVTQGGIYILGYDPEKKTMLTHYSHDMKPLNYFGEPIEPIDKTVGMQAGQVVLLQDKLLFSHTFRSNIVVYDLHGGKLETIQVPGMDTHFVSHSLAQKDNFWHEVRYRVLRLVAYGEDQFFVDIRDDEANKVERFFYNMKSNTWFERKVVGTKMFYLQNKEYSIEEDDEGYMLKPD